MEDDGFYYTVISEDTVIEVTGVESGKIDVSASASDKEALGKKFYDFGWLNEFERYNLTPNDDGTYTFTVRQGKLEGDPISPRYCRQVIAIPDTINTGTVFIDGDEVYGNVGEQERNNWIVEATTVKLRAVPATGYKFSKWVAKNFAATFADNTNPNTTYTVWIQNQGDKTLYAAFEHTLYDITTKYYDGNDFVASESAYGKIELGVTQAHLGGI